MTELVYIIVAAELIARAIPKSVTLILPVSVIKILCGFTSQCTIPIACACSSPSAIAIVILTASCTETRA